MDNLLIYISTWRTSHDVWPRKVDWNVHHTLWRYATCHQKKERSFQKGKKYRHISNLRYLPIAFLKLHLNYDYQTPEKLKKIIIVGAVLDLKTNQQSQYRPISLILGRIGCADYLVDSKWPPRFENNFNDTTFHHLKTIACSDFSCIIFFLQLMCYRNLFISRNQV